MAPVLARTHDIVFTDPIGDRRPLTDRGEAESLEVLTFRPELTAVSSFEFALRERVSRFEHLHHTSYDRIRSVERVQGGAAAAGKSSLVLVSERTPGVRLSDMLERVEGQEVRLDINTALSLTRRLVPAAALLHEHAADAANGAIGAERIVVTPDARVVIVEHVLGSALEQLRFTHERYWRELRIPVPRAIGGQRFDQRTDVTQLGLVVLELVLGRRLRDEEYPSQVGELVASAWAHSPAGGLEPLPAGLRAWLRCALQLDPRSSFRSAVDARIELDRMLADSSPAPVALETFLVEYHGSREAPPPVMRPRPAVKLELAEPVAVRTAPAPSAPVAAPVPIATSPVAVPQPGAPQTMPAPPAPSSAPVPAPAAAAPLEMFEWPPQGSTNAGVEQKVEVKMPAPSRQRRGRMAALIVVSIATLSGGAVAALRLRAPALPPVLAGTLNIDSNPTGASAIVDGERRGVTPLTLTLAPGSHRLELSDGGEPRTLQINVPPGGQVSQYIELPKTMPLTGHLQIRTEPAGASVVVDGVPRGTSPITIDTLTAGAHVVALEHPLGSVKQQVILEAGATASLVVPLATAPAGPASGWIAVSAPIAVQLHENGRLLGSSETDRIMVPVGKHDIEVSNQQLGYRAVRSVQVVAGKVATVALDMPKQRLAVNAIPWAEVWIDGERVGETPIGDASVTVGSHEILFRHPELGERRQTVTVSAAAPSRVSMDLRKK